MTEVMQIPTSSPLGPIESCRPTSGTACLYVPLPAAFLKLILLALFNALSHHIHPSAVLLLDKHAV